MNDVPTVDMTKQELPAIPFERIRTNVNWLILSDNRIKHVPRQIKNLRCLTRLALNDNRIEEITAEIGECTGITWMDLTRNKLKFLPNSISALTKITGLGLSENEFEEMPACIYQLKNLRKFGFFSNRIRTVSPDISNLRALIKLDLSNNRLESIPDEFCALTNLSWLNLSNNKLKRLPPGLNNLKKLEELGLGMNELSELPDMSSLHNLRILPVFKNKLKEVHPSLFSLHSIEKLDFSDNEIRAFPYEALNNPALKYLNLRNNKIENIMSMYLNETASNITLIDISENCLKCVPVKFFKSFNQKTAIRLGSNPFEAKRPSLPAQKSLLQICFTKILNEKSLVDPWLTGIFKRRHVCDQCHSYFVTDPCFSYSFSSLDADSRFVLEKMLCSVRCVRKCEAESQELRY